MTKKQREPKFVWKDVVHCAPDLTNASKRTAIFLLDTYIYQPNAEYFAKNVTIAKKMGISVRSLQRHLKELRVKGYLQQTKKKGKRCLSPNYGRLPSEETSEAPHNASDMTKSTVRDDKTATHIKKKEFKKITSGVSRSGLKCVFLSADDQFCLEEWMAWVETSSSYQRSEILEAVRNGTSYSFPSRYPPSNAEDQAAAKGFFDAFMECSRN